MKLTDTQRKQIEEDLAAFTMNYANKSKEERKAKGQFFTPASLVLKMLEMMDCIQQILSNSNAIEEQLHFLRKFGFL